MTPVFLLLKIVTSQAFIRSMCLDQKYPQHPGSFEEKATLNQKPKQVKKWEKNKNHCNGNRCYLSSCYSLNNLPNTPHISMESLYTIVGVYICFFNLTRTEIPLSALLTDKGWSKVWLCMWISSVLLCEKPCPHSWHFKSTFPITMYF